MGAEGMYGGIAGCGFAAEQFTDLTAQDVTITVGDDCRWIGGITGYAGGYPAEGLGMKAEKMPSG